MNDKNEFLDGLALLLFQFLLLVSFSFSFFFGDSTDSILPVQIISLMAVTRIISVSLDSVFRYWILFG